MLHWWMDDLQRCIKKMWLFLKRLKSALEPLWIDKIVEPVRLKNCFVKFFFFFFSTKLMEKVKLYMNIFVKPDLYNFFFIHN